MQCPGAQYLVSDLPAPRGDGASREWGGGRPHGRPGVLGAGSGDLLARFRLPQFWRIQPAPRRRRVLGTPGGKDPTQRLGRRRGRGWLRSTNLGPPAGAPPGRAWRAAGDFRSAPHRGGVSKSLLKTSGGHVKKQIKGKERNKEKKEKLL